jgi:hypothetical protein
MEELICFLAKDLSTETATSNQYKVFLLFLLQSPWAVNSISSLVGLDSVLLQLPASEFAFLITTLHGPNGKHSLYYWRSLFTALLSSNRRYIVACSCVAGTCLLSLCLVIVIFVTTFRESATVRVIFLMSV